MLKSLTNKNVIFIAVVAIISFSLAACAGFDLGDVIKVKTPTPIQQSHGYPSTMSLNEAEFEYQTWYESVQRAGLAWQENIEKGAEIKGLLGQLAMNGLNEAGPTLAGIPVLGPSLPVVTALGGLFLGMGRLRKEKEASFRAGLKESKTLV